MWGVGLRADDPEASDPRRWRGFFFLGKTPSAVRDAIRTSETALARPPPLINSALRPSTTECMRSTQCRLALWLGTELAQVLLRSFRPVLLTRRLTTAARVWLSCLVLTPPSCSQNTASASSRVQLRSTALLLSPTSTLTKRSLVNMLLQPGILSVEEGFAASPSLELQISNLVTSSESSTSRPCAFRWTLCSTTAKSPVLPQGRLWYPRSQPLRIDPSQLQPRPHPRPPCLSS